MSKSKYMPRKSIEKMDTWKNWPRWLPIVLIFAAVFAVYANGLRGPFVFDDTESILQNESIRNLWSFDIFNPPGGRGETVGGRPLLNASFAANYAISGLNTWSYHVMNVAIHALAALALFGVARRTAAQIDAIRAAGSTLFAAAVAVVWAVHPLLTGAVTYTVQRAESLCGLLYLLAVYCFVRGTTGPHASRWLTFSVIACFAAVATKEVAVTIPVIVFLYDRTFVAGSFREAWRARRGYYAALLASWVFLAVLAAALGGRGMSAGYASGMGWWDYALTQCWAIVRYLRLAFWPTGQIFDYGILLAGGVRDVWPQMLLLFVLKMAVLWALWKKPAWGFLGACFFLILAPTSSVAPIVTQTVAEHRMYLPLIAVVAGALAALWTLLKNRHAAFGLVAMAVGVALGVTTIARNRTYRSEESVWRDAAQKHPDSARAWTNLGAALQQAAKYDAAGACYARAVALNPKHAFAHSNWGSVLLAQGKSGEALPHLQTAAELEPDDPDMLMNLGSALIKTGRAAEAVAPLRKSMQLKPAADAQFNLGMALAAAGMAAAKAGRFAEAEQLLREAVRAQPDNVDARGNLGNVLLMLERAPEAIREYEEVLRLKPGDNAVRGNLELAREMLRGR